MAHAPKYAIAEEIISERIRQDQKWGEQNHPDGTGPDWPAIPIGGSFTKDRADMARRACQSAASHGTVTWHHILAEEFAEAMAEADPVALRAELIQAAAVCAAWVEAIDRRPS